MEETEITIHQDKLMEILSSIDGVEKVYFQPPMGSKLVYPCIIYNLNKLDTMYAGGKRYLSWPSYSLTLIDHDPESIIQKRIMDLSGDCFVSFDRFFTMNGLNHWTYSLSFTKSLW